MSKLFGYLSYRDVEVAITLLEALGFETTTRQQDDGGATIHAELRLDDAVVMVAPAEVRRRHARDKRISPHYSAHGRMRLSSTAVALGCPGH